MNFDTESITQRLEDRLRSKSSWSELLFWGTNERLIRVMAEGLAELARYDEYLTRETKWSLARNTSSLLYQSRVLGYDAKRRQGARGKVRISASETFNSTPSVTVDIPKYTVVSNGGDTKATIMNTNNLLAGVDQYLDLDVVQGTPKSFTTNALGDLNEAIQINNSAIEDSFHELFVNDEKWTETDDIRLNDGDEKVFQLENLPDFSGVQLLFGDNLNGRKLATGDVVVFRYVETLGAEGNITGINIIDTVDSTIYDTNGDTVEMFVKNTEPITGGKDVESKEDIRSNAPNLFTAGDRAVNREDYNAILGQNANVLKSTVWGAYEINEDAGTPGEYLPDEENFVYVSVVSTSKENITSTVEQELREFINEFKSPTDILSFQDVEFLRPIFNIDVFVRDRSVVLNEVKSSTIDSVATEYDVENREFNENIYESDYQRFIDEIDGVDYHNTTIELAEFDEFNNSQYEADFSLKLAPVQSGSINFYVKHTSQTDDEWTLFATDDGNGDLTAESGFGLDPTTTNVNYTDGTVSLRVATGLPLPDFSDAAFNDFDLKAEYQIVDNNFITQNRQQIFHFYKSNVTVQYTSN